MKGLLHAQHGDLDGRPDSHAPELCQSPVQEVSSLASNPILGPLSFCPEANVCLKEQDLPY